MSDPTNTFSTEQHTLANTCIPEGLGPSFQDIPSTQGAYASAPALPPRPDLGLQPFGGMNSYNNYGGMTGSYGMGMGMGMGYGGFGGYGGYGGYGNSYGMGVGGPYGGFNRYGDIENSFIQLAEERSRPALESIQSVVHAVGSVAAMLDNTFLALTSSFRAILGVADNFGRLRSMFAQIWTSLAAVRALGWLARRLLLLLGIRTQDEFQAWAAAEAAAAAAPEPDGARRPGWPALLFLAVIGAAPYLLMKMMSALGGGAAAETLSSPASWRGAGRAVAVHARRADTPGELSFGARQVLTVAPRRLQPALWNSGWLMASADGQTAGLVPVTYIKLVRPDVPAAPSAPAAPAAPAAHAAPAAPEPDFEKLYREEGGL